MADKPTFPPALQPSPAFITQSSTAPSTFSTSSSSNNKSADRMSAIPQSGQDKKPFDISNLMSPPELPSYESFAQTSNMSNSRASAAPEYRRPIGPNPPLSPPISPLNKATNNVNHGSPSVKDPILYPVHDLSVSPPQRPLFARDESIERQRLVEEHVYTRPSTMFLESTPPQREDYELILYFQSQVMKKYKENPRGWLQRERALLLADRRATAKHNNFRLHPILPAKPQTIRTNAQGVQKNVRKPKPVTNGPPRVPNHGPRTTIRVNQNPPAPRVHNTIRVSSTPDPQRPPRTVAPNREDKAFDTIPDYCPPVSTLPNKPNSLKVDWKGAPIDLSGDPNRNLLHADELNLAAGLRLDCATYLTSKRRMFERRLECLRVGKEFRKTDAQQACKIDVNKASKLWTAFEKVGWLNAHWVAKFL